MALARSVVHREDFRSKASPPEAERNEISTDAMGRATVVARTISGTTITASTALIGPGTVADAGDVRLAHGGAIRFRNNANGANIRALAPMNS